MSIEGVQENFIAEAPSCSMFDTPGTIGINSEMGLWAADIHTHKNVDNPHSHSTASHARLIHCIFSEILAHVRVSLTSPYFLPTERYPVTQLPNLEDCVQHEVCRNGRPLCLRHGASMS